MKKYSFPQGVHPESMKYLTENKPIETMPEVQDYFISLSQHIGSAAVEVVSKGDEVARGQLIAKAVGKVSANIFSSVSGVVVDFYDKKNVQGMTVKYIHIRAEGDREVKLPPLETIDKESILNRIEEAGIVGLGGAGFPTAVKCRPTKPVDTLLINAAECESYLTCDYRLMLDYTEGVADGIRLLAQAIGVKRVIIGIEDNKMPAYEKFAEKGFEMKLLKKKYPQGAEKTLIYSCTGRKVPNRGGLPMDVGVVVANVGTAYAVHDAVRSNNPLYKRVVTVSGLGVNEPKNLWVLNGTPHRKIFKYCGGVKETTKKLVSGGPMMGYPLTDIGYVSTKTEGGLLALTQEELNILEPSNCIHCGRCAKVCPMKLMPMYIDFHMLSGDVKNAVKYGAMDCFECGSCSFVCPAKRWLVQSIRMAKQKVRENNTK